MSIVDELTDDPMQAELFCLYNRVYGRIPVGADRQYVLYLIWRQCRYADAASALDCGCLCAADCTEGAPVAFAFGVMLRSAPCHSDPSIFAYVT